MKSDNDIAKELHQAIGLVIRKPDGYVVFRCKCGAETRWYEGLIKYALDKYKQPCYKCNSFEDKLITIGEG